MYIYFLTDFFMNYTTQTFTYTTHAHTTLPLWPYEHI
jgi:hypothetical protein